MERRGTGISVSSEWRRRDGQRRGYPIKTPKGTQKTASRVGHMQIETYLYQPQHPNLSQLITLGFQSSQFVIPTKAQCAETKPGGDMGAMRVDSLSGGRNSGLGGKGPFDPTRSYPILRAWSSYRTTVTRLYSIFRVRCPYHQVCPNSSHCLLSHVFILSIHRTASVDLHLTFTCALAGWHNPALDHKPVCMSLREHFDFFINSMTSGLSIRLARVYQLDLCPLRSLGLHRGRARVRAILRLCVHAPPHPGFEDPCAIMHVLCSYLPACVSILTG